MKKKKELQGEKEISLSAKIDLRKNITIILDEERGKKEALYPI